MKSKFKLDAPLVRLSGTLVFSYRESETQVHKLNQNLLISFRDQSSVKRSKRNCPYVVLLQTNSSSGLLLGSLIYIVALIESTHRHVARL
jgi:hypothetical protein